MSKLVDPIEGKDQGEEKIVKEIKSVNDISFEDLQQIPEKVADLSHPFANYPFEKIVFGKDEKGNDVKIPSAWIVVLYPQFEPPQDVSGVGVTIRKKKYSKNGNVTGEIEQQVTIRTSHNVVLIDYDNARQNVDVVFDREFTLKGGQKVLCSIVPSHSVRAQLMYKFDAKKQRVFVDNRYALVDMRQVNKLRKVFDIVMFDKLRNERLSNKHYKEE